MKCITISDIIESSGRKDIIRKNFNKKGLDICVEYPAIFRSSKVLRDFIVDMADFFHFKSTWKSRLTLIADELNNNSIEYGSKENDINKMIIRTLIKGDKVEVCLEVEDTGNGKDAKTALEMEGLRDKNKTKGFDNHKSIRGRGLFMIISRLVDELYFRDLEKGGLVVGIKKEIEIEK
ncbi:ATP-binding protein [Candidatus Gracilibacteria bacterium]|nr:ATP-binding protein [Candidatus Gracilibacteria bacterium]